MPTALVEAVENEDTPQSYAYAFLTASQIEGADLSALFDNIEDIVAQADETPETLYVSLALYFCSRGMDGLLDLIVSFKVVGKGISTKLFHKDSRKLGCALFRNYYCGPLFI